MRIRYVRQFPRANVKTQAPTVYRGLVPHVRRRAQQLWVPPRKPPTATTVARLSLEAGLEPTTRTLHKLVARARKASGAGAVTLMMALYESSNNRSGDLSAGPLTTSFAQYDLAISDVNAATIVSYANLEIRLWATSPSEVVDVDVAEVWLDTPEGVGAAVLRDHRYVMSQARHRSYRW